MPRPMHRGVSGVQVPEVNKECTDYSLAQNDDVDKYHSSDQSYIALKFPVRLSLSETYSPSKTGNIRNIFTPEGLISRSWHKLAIGLLRISLFIIVLVTLSGSFWWSLSISSSSRGTIIHSYRRLEEQLVSDMRDIRKISLGSTRLKELSYCSEELENYVPCFNISENLASGFSDGNEYDRHCWHTLNHNCLVLPPKNYRLPIRWPTGKDVIWATNVKISVQQVLSSRSMMKRMMMEEEQISFRSVSLMIDSVEDYSHQIAEMLGLRNESGLTQAGVRTILDIGCGYGGFGAHLFSKGLITMCIAPYEASGSQVQLTLERGLPAMIGSFYSKQLPYPSLSFDMLHCLRCGFDWDKKDGLLLLEMDRVLKPGGYFVWTSPLTNSLSHMRNKANQIKWNFIRTFAESICWNLISQQDETVIWMKRPVRKNVTVLGVHSADIAEDTGKWKIALRNYWSLLSPLLFSDHPKRPGDEDPSPPFNMFRNVLDMNARFGGFNSALLDAGKSVWVMNVVPVTGQNYLPLILDRGFVGALHDWCEAFPTYPRTYDLVHADGLLSLHISQHRCTVLDLFTEINRLLRPEGWLIIRDSASVIESSRALTTQLKWDARIVEIESNNEEKLLICQKPFIKRQK